MSAASTVLRGRQRAEELMLDTCTITRVTARPTNEDTGVTAPTVTTVYTGKCKVQASPVPTGEPRDRGEASIQVMHLQLHIPIAVGGVTTDVQVDDVATITASALDPDLVGKVLTIRATSHKSFLTARRFDVQETGS